MKTKLNKRLAVELVLTLLFLAAALFFVYKSDPKAELQLSVNVKADNAATFRLFNGKAVVARQEIEDTGAFQVKRFGIPKGKIRGLRLDLGDNPGSVQLKSITVSGRFTFTSYRLEGKLIARVFTRSHGLKRQVLKKRRYIVEPVGPGSWIAPDDAFYKTLEQMREDTLFYYAIALVAAFLFFLLVHWFDLSVLFARIPAAVLVNGMLVFLLVLTLPMVKNAIFFSGQPELTEKRRLNPKPEFRFDSLFGFSRRYTPYYSDHFAFRGSLIYMNNLLKVKLFGISPVPGVMMGKEGWLFLHKQNLRPSTIDYYRALSPMTPEQLDNWRRQLEKRRDWLAQKGIDFLFVVVPNKNTIYPEYMPDRIRKANPVSRMDQLLEHLRKNSTVPFIDLRPALLEAKSRYPVYSATDTHWNDYGAYIAYREIIHFISRRFEAFAGMTPRPLSRFKIETVDRSGGDLAIMLSLQKEILREDMIQMIPVPPLSAKMVDMPNVSRYVKQRRTENPSAAYPNIVMVHDSFYKKLMPFLSEQFSRVLYIWDWDMGFYPGIIEKENPKLVINEMAERFLLQ